MLMLGGVTVALTKCFLKLYHIPIDLFNNKINIPFAQSLQAQVLCRWIFHLLKFGAQFELKVVCFFEAAAYLDVLHVHVPHGILWLVWFRGVSAGKDAVVLLDFVSKAINAFQCCVALCFPRIRVEIVVVRH